MRTAPPSILLSTTLSAWRKRVLVLLLFCTLTFVLYPLPARLRLGEWAFPFDDPWIHQVYARNLAWHGQYAFNLGEPSTGSSAPLWTLLMVPAYWLGLPPVLWALAWGLLSLAGLGAVLWSWAERHFTAPLPLLLTAAVLLTPHIAWTSVEGMETALVAALGLGILCRLDRRDWVGYGDPFLEGLLNGLLLWLRPEAPLLTLIVAWQRRRQGWRLLPFAAGYLLLAGPYVGFHLAVGGSLLPQTVSAKVAYYGRAPTPASIVGFLGNLVLIFAPGIWPLLVPLIVLALWQMARRRDWPWAPGLTWAGLTLAAAAVRLPVVLHFGRHFAPVLPVLFLAAGQALQGLPPRLRRAFFTLAACLLLIGVVIGVSFYGPLCEEILRSQTAMGRWIAAHLPPGEAIATHDIGAIGYFGGRPVVDTLALITPELTEIVATRDTAGLLAYLQQRDVRFFATLEELYRDIAGQPGVHSVSKLGRMELLQLE